MQYRGSKQFVSIFVMLTQLYIDVVLFGSSSHVIMMTPRVDPLSERGERMQNRDRQRNRASLVKNLSDKMYNSEIWGTHGAFQVCRGIPVTFEIHCSRQTNSSNLQPDRQRRGVSGPILQSCPCTACCYHDARVVQLLHLLRMAILV